MKTLLFGYGNVDRQDDGVAWHILRALMSRFNLPLPEDLDVEYHDPINQLDFVFQLQLTPEIASDLIGFDRVCFIDAHTGAIPDDIHFENVKPSFQKSPFTHHLTASSLLSITETLFQKFPETILVSVRGFDFGFSRSLSNSTAILSEQAADLIANWIKEEQKPQN
ncbi:MAG: hypothetical protein NTZ74_06955 [Chloroflexi bacterium]|nr:hypothetical protein [Chloroflexota bacterium]